MAARVRPIEIAAPGVELSHDEWVELSGIAGVQFSEQHQIELSECIRNYTAEVVSHHEGARSEQVKDVLEDIKIASKATANELMRLFEHPAILRGIKESSPEKFDELMKQLDYPSVDLNEKESDCAYHLVGELIELFYERQFKTPGDFGQTIQSLKNIERICGLVEANFKNFEVFDSRLSDFLWQISQCYSSASGKSSYSNRSYDFIHAVCTTVTTHLKQSPWNQSHIFSKLKSVTYGTAENNRDKIKEKIREGQKRQQVEA